MKPITLSPDQLDAALAVAPVRHLSPLQVDHSRNVRVVTSMASCGHKRHARGFGCTHDGCANDSRQFEHEHQQAMAQAHERAGHVTPIRKPRRGRAR
jgi:hypothetical protein